MRPDASQESRNRHSTNGSSQNGSSPHTNGSVKNVIESDTNGFHLNGDSHPPSEPIVHDNTPFYGHDREEVTRILLQGLTDLGYRSTALQLCKESGYQMETASVAAFRGAVQRGEWEEAESILFGSSIEESDDGGVILQNGLAHMQGSPSRSKSGISLAGRNGHVARPGLPLVEGADVPSLKFLLRQQKYLELLERGELNAALSVLRNELTPLKRDTGRIHALSRLLVCPTADDLRSQAEWNGSEASSRNLLLSELSKSISPSVMIPEHRLATLLSAVQHEQSLTCRYHNTKIPPSLYTDHECTPDDFPVHTLTELRHHSDEAWCLSFSHDGSMLATGGRDGLVCVYDTVRWRLRHEFREHGKPDRSESGICCVAFSPDNRHLISCSKTNEVVILDMRDGHRVVKLDHYDYPPTSVAWLPDSRTFVVGTQDTSYPLSLHRLVLPEDNAHATVEQGQEIHSFRVPPLPDNVRTAPGGFRVSACAVSADGTRLAAATIGDHIMVYDLQSHRLLTEFTLEDKLTSIAFAPDDSRELLISMDQGRVFTMSAVTGEMLQSYEGSCQGEFVIPSAYGGAENHLVLSGSEDSTIHIWRRETGLPITILSTHSSRAVNAVAWHPTNPAIFASAGDDRRVRIWASANAMQAPLAAPSPPALEAAEVLVGQTPSQSNSSLPTFGASRSSLFTL